MWHTYAQGAEEHTSLECLLQRGLPAQQTRLWHLTKLLTQYAGLPSTYWSRHMGQNYHSHVEVNRPPRCDERCFCKLADRNCKAPRRRTLVGNPGLDMVVSLNEGPQFRPQHSIILLMGTLNRETPIWCSLSMTASEFDIRKKWGYLVSLGYCPHSATVR